MCTKYRGCANTARRARRWLVALALFPVAVLAGPNIQHWQTDNGAEVYFVREAGLPMVDVRVVFHAGAARDGRQPGVAKLTNGMLQSGAGDLNADQIAERFARVGARMSTGAERDMAWVSLRSLTEPKLLQPAEDVLASMLSQPTFPQADFERDRSNTLVAIEQQKQSPQAVASRAFYKAIYGDHPYGSPPIGTSASIKKLSRADLIAFHKRYYVARNAVVAIVGDMDRPGAEALANKLVGRLPAGERAAPLPPVAPLKAAVTVRKPYPASQTTVLIGQPGDTRTDPDYFALYVGNHALGGGGLVSRLSEEVREKRGLAYSVYSYFLPMARKGPFIMATQTRNDQTKKTIDVMRKTLDEFLHKGISEKQLKAAKENITGGFPLRIDSNSKIVEYLAMIGFYGLPSDYLQRFNARVEAVTRKQITDAMRSRLDPTRMVTVVVGSGS